MSINRISIIRSLGRVFSKTKKILGIQGENMKDVLLFALDEKIEGNAIVEVELPNGTRSFIELTEVEDGYELPVKSVLTEQVGFVKFQLRILQNKVELFKNKAKIVHEEIEKIRNSFPFNALPMLSSQEKIDEYMSELRIRGKVCANEKQELEKKIMNLTGGTVNG